MCENHSHICGCSVVTSVCQNLQELDFERGIWSAALNGEIKKVEKLLTNGICPSKCDSSGYTALHYAARNGHIDVCQLLLNKGANANKQTPGGATPLHRAAYMGHTNIIRLLIKFKTDALLTDSDGKTALHKAIENNQIDATCILLQAFPELKEIKDKKGLTAVQYIQNNDIILSRLPKELYS